MPCLTLVPVSRARPGARSLLLLSRYSADCWPPLPHWPHGASRADDWDELGQPCVRAPHQAANRDELFHQRATPARGVPARERRGPVLLRPSFDGSVGGWPRPGVCRSRDRIQAKRPAEDRLLPQQISFFSRPGRRGGRGREHSGGGAAWAAARPPRGGGPGGNGPWL
jgi:hypothetical protein